MTRHVCGTCRFFRANDGNGKFGWCGHPLKQTTTDVKIHVRYGELNCRNDWDNDLWQLREDGDRVLDISMAKRSNEADDRIQVMGQHEERRTLGQDAPRIVTPMALQEDVVIGEGLDQPRLVSEETNRELLRRAREQYRSRRQPTRPEGPLPRHDAHGASPLHRSEPIVISNEVQPLQIGLPPGPDLTRQSDGGRARRAESPPLREAQPNRFSSVPDIEETFDLPQRPARRADVVHRVDDFEMVSIRHYDEATKPGGAQTRAEAIWEYDEEIEAPIAQVESPRKVDEAPAEPVHTSTQGDVDRSDRLDSGDGIPPWGYVEPRRGRTGAMDLRDSPTATPPSMSSLWDDLPRCCRTCRDFRSAGSGGDGGWCTNRWAFRHRRMVDLDRLTCQTTIGDWWLPSDEAWQDDFDVSRHVMPTPLMDKWFGRLRDDEEDHQPLVAYRTRRRS